MILSNEPIQFHLQHPEVFLVIARTFVFLANAITIVVLANYALQHTDWLGVLAAFSVVLLYFAVHPSAMAGWHPLLGAAQIVLYSVQGYIIATLVILQDYPSFLSWLAGLVTHQGLYGSGPEGLRAHYIAATCN